jgi:hypothetical protein
MVCAQACIVFTMAGSAVCRNVQKVNLRALSVRFTVQAGATLYVTRL